MRYNNNKYYISGRVIVHVYKYYIPERVIVYKYYIPEKMSP